MSLDELSPHALNDNGSDEIEDDDDSDDDDDSANVAMVPLADMLNARYECENVRVHRPKIFGSNSSFRPSFSTRNTIFG
jgi:hypothetical protein